jgi:hypothetical protein
MEADKEKDLEFEPKEPTDERELLVHLLSMEVIDWPIRLKMVTKDVDFSSPIEQAALATTLKAAEIIDQLKALDIMGYQDVIDRMKEDATLDMQTKSVIQKLFDSGLDPTKMDVPTLLRALMDAMHSGVGGNGQATSGTSDNKPQKVATLEDIKKGQEAKSKGMLGAGPGDMMRKVLARTEVKTPSTGVTTA